MDNLPKFNEPKQVEKVQIDTLKNVELNCPQRITVMVTAFSERFLKHTWWQVGERRSFGISKEVGRQQGLDDSYLDSSKTYIVCHYGLGSAGVDMRSKIGDHTNGYDCSQKFKEPYDTWICKPITYKR